MKLSEIVRLAADKCLWDGNSWPPRDAENYSCCAIYRALEEEYEADFPYAGDADEEIISILASMGLPDSSWLCFEEFSFGEERQGVRYAWLHFVADYLEEQGK